MCIRDSHSASLLACSRSKVICDNIIPATSRVPTKLLGRCRRFEDKALIFRSQRKANKTVSCLNCATKEVREALLTFVDMFNVLYMQRRALRYAFSTSKIATNLTWLFSKQKIFLVMGRFRLFKRLTITAYHKRFPLKFSWHRGTIFQRRVRIPEKSASEIPSAIVFESCIHAAENQVFSRSQTLLLYVHRYIFCVVSEQFQASFSVEAKYCLWGYLLDRIRWIIKIQI